MNSNKQPDNKSVQGDSSSKPNQGKIEVKAMDLDDKVSIDCNTAIQNLGSEDLFYMMLARFE